MHQLLISGPIADVHLRVPYRSNVDCSLATALCRDTPAGEPNRSKLSRDDIVGVAFPGPEATAGANDRSIVLTVVWVGAVKAQCKGAPGRIDPGGQADYAPFPPAPPLANEIKPGIALLDIVTESARLGARSSLVQPSRRGMLWSRLRCGRAVSVKMSHALDVRQPDRAPGAN
jgi:hypothetical protein